VKCDLASPACTQCQKQKLKCPGFQRRLRWISTSEVGSTDQLFQPGSYGDSGRRSASLSSDPQNPLDDDASALINHYFTKVCKIAGCFDSDLNPFRIFAASMMSYSKPVYLLLQASSAAHLSRQDPRMRIKALSLQSEAFSAVRDDIGRLQEPNQSIVTDELMLTSIMAGLTSAWYDVNDLGESHVLGGQVLLYLWLQPQRNRLK
jgi:hypothetical protein